MIEELIQLAKDIRAASARGERLGPSDGELTSYGAMGANDSAAMAVRDDTLRRIAQELVESVHKNATIDWAIAESVRL